MYNKQILSYLNELRETEEKKTQGFEELRCQVYAHQSIKEIVEKFEEKSFKEVEVDKKDRGQLNLFIKLKMIHSELKDKQEINEKIQSLCINIAKLRSVLISKDFNLGKQTTKRILRGEYCSIPILIDEINLFEKKISDADESFNEFLLKIPRSLETKMTIEAEKDEMVKELRAMAEKQRQNVANLGKMFVKFTKQLIKDREYRAFIEDS